MAKTGFFQVVRYTQREHPKFAVISSQLGLTAYGDTEDEAWDRLEKMFHSLIVVTKKHEDYDQLECTDQSYVIPALTIRQTDRDNSGCTTQIWDIPALKIKKEL